MLAPKQKNFEPPAGNWVDAHSWPQEQRGPILERLNDLSKPTTHKVRLIVKRIETAIKQWQGAPNDHEAHDAINEYDIIERVLIEELC